MGQKPQSIQDTFNDIADAISMDEVKEAIALLKNHTKEERQQIAEQINDEVLTDFLSGMPTVRDMKTDLRQRAREYDFFDENDLEMLQVALQVIKTVTKEQGKAASPILKDIVKHTSALSKKDYNNPEELILTVVKGHAAGKKKIKRSEAYRKKRNNPSA